MRISWYLLSVQFWCSLSNRSLFTLLETQKILGATLEVDQGKQRKDEEGKEEEKIKQGRVVSSNYIRIICKYQFSCVVSLLYLAYIVHACVYVFGSLAFIGMGFCKGDNVLQPCLSISLQPWSDGLSCILLRWISGWFRN